MKGYKGFDKDLKCRGYQFEAGKEYEHKGKVEVCHSGFHFCENPLDIFSYYSPADSRYCEVEGNGEADTGDLAGSKVACSKLTIGAEIGLPGLIKAGVEYIKSKVDWDNAKESNTGYQSVATNTGKLSAATNTGDQSAATNTGYKSAATVNGKESVAINIGIKGKAKGALGCWLVLAEYIENEDYEYHLETVKSVQIDGIKIKSDTFYILKDGEFIEWLGNESYFYI